MNTSGFITGGFCKLCRRALPFCHRCEDMGGDIMPHCNGTIQNAHAQTFDDCYCTGLACHCGEPADGRCTWPMALFLPTLVSELQVGDECMNTSRSRQGHIIDISDRSKQDMVMDKHLLVKVRRKRKKSGGDRRVDEYYWLKADVVLTLQRVQCGQPGCFRHIRDLGDDVSYICSNHWIDQLEMIRQIA